MSRDFPQDDPGRHADIRAGDEDRERLVSELREHTVAGRITPEELEQRLQEAYEARTTAELDAARRDLPAPSGAAAVELASRRAHLRRRLIQDTGGLMSVFVIGNVVWLTAGAHHGQYWPVWILLLLVLRFARAGWALYGPAPDLDEVEREFNARRERRRRRNR